MSQNITLMGASYSAVPAVTLPRTGGGTARFDDCTVVTAAASDVASGKVFVASDGTITTGTNSGGGGGADMPVFTLAMASDYSTVQSVTCSMTFAECSDYANDNDAALVEMSVQGDSNTYLMSASLHSASAVELSFVVQYGGTPMGDVTIRSNGTCSFTEPSSIVTTLTATTNGTYTDAQGRLYNEVTVNVPSGSSMNVQVAQSTSRASSSTYTKLISLTCSTTGTYDVYWSCYRSSTGGTSGSQLYIGGSTSGSANTTFTNHIQNNHRTGVQISANQEVAVYARSRGSNYYAYVGTLIIKQTS